MDNKRKRVILLSILVFLLIILGILIYIDKRNSNNLDLLLINTEKEDGNVLKQNDSEGVNNNILDAETSVIEKSDSNSGDFNSSDVLEDNYDCDNSTNIIDKDTDYSEDTVVNYFSDMESEIEQSTTFKDKFKEYFVLIVDFIFYDTEINGYTFNELSSNAKTKIIAIALKMDNKIEEFIPGYKETISSTSSRVYNNVKEKLVTLYMDIAVDLCDNNNEGCNKAKEIFGEIKDACSIGWDFIKSFASSGALKVKEWYEIYSGK